MANVDQVTNVTNYQIFDDAASDADSLQKSLEEQKTKVLTAKSAICSPDVFLGPIAESVEDALVTLDSRLQIAIENFQSIFNYFEQVSDCYQKGDKKAEKLVLMRSEEGKLSIEEKGLVGDTNEEQIFNYFKSKGLTTAEACGIMACIYHESRFLPGAESDRPGDESIGICQWLAERRTALENYCRENGKDVTDLEAQLDFIFYECETTQKVAAMNNLLAITEDSADAAAKAADKWLIDYEGVGRSFKSYPAHTAMRQETARQLYAKYCGK